MRMGMKKMGMTQRLWRTWRTQRMQRMQRMWRKMRRVEVTMARDLKRMGVAQTWVTLEM
jgi:hypothetical protein